MANKDKGGSKSSKTAASKSLKEKRQAKKAKAASSGFFDGNLDQEVAAESAADDR